MTNEQYIKQRADFFKSIPISDWKVVIDFEKIVRNYIKLSQI
jgi:hypothetical protein